MCLLRGLDADIKASGVEIYTKDSSSSSSSMFLSSVKFVGILFLLITDYSVCPYSSIGHYIAAVAILAVYSLCYNIVTDCTD